MKKIVLSSWFLVLSFLVYSLWSMVYNPLFAQAPPTYRVAYLEQRGAEQRKFFARIQGKQVSIDQQKGEFKDTWFLQGLPPLQETTIIQLEGLPPLTLTRKFEPKAKNLYQVHCQLTVKQELIPLTDEEKNLNNQLKPFGIESIHLEGEGRILLDESQNQIIFEEFVLSGEVVTQPESQPWRIEFARVLQPNDL